MFAEVAFPISGFQTFTYKISKKLKPKIQIGSRVKAPFGHRTVQGIVIKIKNSTSFSGKVKDISGLIDDISIMTPELWKLINWISDYYLTPIGQVSKTVFPGTLSTRYTPPKSWYVLPKSIVDDQSIELIENRAPKQFELYQIIWAADKPIKVASLKKHASNPLQVCRALEKHHLVTLFEKSSLPDVTDSPLTPSIKKWYLIPIRNQL